MGTWQNTNYHEPVVKEQVSGQYNFFIFGERKSMDRLETKKILSQEKSYKLIGFVIIKI